MLQVDTGSEDTVRGIQYMATAAVVEASRPEIRLRSVPSTAPIITDIEQVTATKLDNFKVVAGVMNNTKLSDVEERIIQELRAGELLERVSEGLGDDPIEISNEDQEDSEDEIEEITVIDEVTESVEDIPTGDLKPKELRAIIMGYIEMINKVKDRPSREKFNLLELKQISKIDKNVGFIEGFCLALARKCESVKKGFKVGHIFVTHSQVNLILSHGILSRADIANTNNLGDTSMEGSSDILKSLPFNKLRTFIIDFYNFACSKKQFSDIKQFGQKHSMTPTHCRKVMTAVKRELSKAQVVNGKPQGIKVNNIFVSSGWVEKLQSYKIL